MMYVILRSGFIFPSVLPMMQTTWDFYRCFGGFVRTICRISLISTALLLSGCIQYASGYKRKGIAVAAEAAPAPDAGTEETPPDDTAATDAGAASEPATLAETTALVNVCASCHNPTGLAKTVILNKSAIPQLNAAYLGKEKVIHSAFRASFVGEGRKRTVRVMSAAK